ncbi:Regulatory subunit [Zea mays]|uniref:Regulatory subunit n=1 Tax=Zea mays TaxID=4577 RepID=A0A1D6HD22_MAIZE|nr:Regulatory subunit [Zea mays]
MGGVCSRKRSQLVDEGDALQTSPRFSKTSSLKWLLLTLPRSSSDVSGKGQGNEPGRCPSLMELCVARVCQDIDRYSTFAMLPRDLSQQIFNELVNSNRLTEASLQVFRDCALQDIGLGEYPGVKDAWMEVVASQKQSLLSVDISCSEVADSGIDLLRDCSSMQSLACNYCDQISESGLGVLSGLSNLSSLSFKRSNAVTAEGMRAFANLVNLLNLDLEGCLKIHGGLIHLKDLTKLESLNMRYCNYIADSDIKYLTDLTNLKDLQLSCCKITDLGVSYIRGLQKLTHLNLEGCPVTAACLEAISGLSSLVLLNLNRCGIYDDGCENFEGLKRLKVLNLGFNYITDACLVHLKELISLESLNLDSCKIGDDGLSHLKGLVLLQSLELSDTEVGNNGLQHLSGLRNLQSINLSFTLVTDIGVKKISVLNSLKSVNLDNRQITDVGLAALISLTRLTHLDLFGACITDNGTNCFRYNFGEALFDISYLFCKQTTSFDTIYVVADFKNLVSLEVCGGFVTDAGVKNIKDLKALTLLNLSQNANLTDKTLELISGIVLPCWNKCTSFLQLKSHGHLVYRPDCFDQLERVKLTGVQCWSQTPE